MHLYSHTVDKVDQIVDIQYVGYVANTYFLVGE